MDPYEKLNPTDLGASAVCNLALQVSEHGKHFLSPKWWVTATVGAVF